jgi:hypothetical protein
MGGAYGCIRQRSYQGNIWRLRSIEQANAFSISSRQRSFSARDQPCRASESNRVDIFFRAYAFSETDERGGGRGGGTICKVRFQAGPYGSDLVKLGADILLQLRQITLPLVELQLFLDMNLLSNLLTTRAHNFSVRNR